MDEMIRTIRDSLKAAGSEQIYLTGEIEWQRRTLALKESTVLPEQVVSTLSDLAIERFRFPAFIRRAANRLTAML